MKHPRLCCLPARWSRKLRRDADFHYLNEYHWKVYHRRKAELIKRGIPPKLAHTTAWSAKGPWKMSHTPGVRMALNSQLFDQMGLVSLCAHCHM